MTEKYSVPLKNRIFRFFVKPAFRLLFWTLAKLTITGKENIPYGKPYMVAINHVSLYEAPFVTAFWPEMLEGMGASVIWNVNWLEATTTRYKCLVSHAGLASLYAHRWSTSDGIYHRELIMGGPFWERPQKWLDQSPTTYAKDFRTPMLLSVGDTDYRVPLNNALEMWSVLQRMRVPSRFLVWPEANHWIMKGEDSRRFYEEVHAWLKKWLEA